MVGRSVTWMNYSLIIDADFGQSGGMCWVQVCGVFDCLTLWHVDELCPNSLNTSWIQMPLSMWGLSTRCRCCGDYSRPVSHSVRWGQGCFKIGVLCLFLKSISASIWRENYWNIQAMLMLFCGARQNSSDLQMNLEARGHWKFELY